MDSESGFLTASDAPEPFSAEFTDVEILSVSGVNVVARGRRYGRYWLLKGLREEYRGSTFHRQLLRKEFEIHSRLLHSGIVKAVDMRSVPSLGEAIVMEWIEGTTLEQALENGLADADRQRLAHELVGTVAYVHEQGVVHRDLKLSNVMVARNGGHAVVIDFGLADTDGYAILKQPAGTEGYMSAEQMADALPRASNDVYSLGVILLALSPRYSSVARRCLAPEGRRYANARALQRAMHGIDSRRRVVRRSLLVALFAALVGTSVWLSVRNTGEVERLQGLATGYRSEALDLRDSLRQVQTRLDEESARLAHETERRTALETRQENLDNAINEGKKRIDALYERLRRELPSADLSRHYELMLEYNRQAQAIVGKIEKDYSQLLSPNDMTLLSAALWNHIGTLGMKLNSPSL